MRGDRAQKQRENRAEKRAERKRIKNDAKNVPLLILFLIPGVIESLM